MVGQSKLPCGDMLPSEIVANLIRIYTRDTTRLALNKCGTGEINRAISWKYVHWLLRKIIEKDGFSSQRYKFAIAIEPSDSDPMASTKRTSQEVNDSNGMLAKVLVDNLALWGLLTKNHLLLALCILQDGRVPKDHDMESYWKIPDKDPKNPGKTKSCTMFLKTA